MIISKRLGIIICLTALPFAAGFVVSSWHTSSSSQTTGKIQENRGSISSSDRLTLSSSGDILNLDSNGSTKVVAGRGLIDPVWSGNSLIAVSKTTNSSQINMFSSDGIFQKKLFDGASKVVDNNRFATDLAVSQDGTLLAFVSDKNSALSGIPDNALFVEDLTSAHTQQIAGPASFSGGIATPRFVPGTKQVAYSFYQYDSSSNPISTILMTDTTTRKTTQLTTTSQNAYQEDFSPNATKVIFLTRHDEGTKVTLTIADFDGTTISNQHDLYQGQLAYPRFSTDGAHIYFLEAVKNKGFDLFKAEIGSTSLKNITNITSGSALNGDSSFEVTKK